MAANYVVVRDQGGPQVVAVGVTDDLASLDPEALRRRADGQVFTRLNFSRRIRMAEHADIVADHERAEVLD